MPPGVSSSTSGCPFHERSPGANLGRHHDPTAVSHNDGVCPTHVETVPLGRAKVGVVGAVVVVRRQGAGPTQICPVLVPGSGTNPGEIRRARGRRGWVTEISPASVPEAGLEPGEIRRRCDLQGARDDVDDPRLAPRQADGSGVGGEAWAAGGQRHERCGPESSRPPLRFGWVPPRRRLCGSGRCGG